MVAKFKTLFIAIFSMLVLLSSCVGQEYIRKSAALPATLEESILPPSLPIRGKPIFWNLTTALTVPIEGKFRRHYLPEFSALLVDGNQEIPLPCKVKYNTRTNILVEIKYAGNAAYPQNDNFYIQLTSPDLYKKQIIVKRKNKKLNNKFKDERWITVRPDYLSPYISVIASTPSMTRGGSGVVIFEARDEKIKSVELYDNRGKRFLPLRFVRDGYYISMLGWYIAWDKYNLSAIVKDEAGNIATNRIFMPTKNKQYRVLNYRFNRSFNQPIGKLQFQSQNMSTNEAFNSVAPKKKEFEWAMRHRETGQKVNLMWLATYLPWTSISNFSMKKFDPLGKCRVSAEYGQIRNYHYKNNVVRTAYHLGIDLTLRQQMPITNSNPGIVVFSGHNGGYGNTILISYGLGIYGLYAHCTELFVKAGDNLKGGELIATTGRTGMVTGDHLHFSLFAQGVFIDPSEWMNSDWVDKNINQVIKLASRGLFLRAENYE